MFTRRIKYFTLFILGFFIIPYSFSQEIEVKKNDKTLEKGIDIIKRYFYEEGNWHIAQPSVGKDVKCLINFIEDEPVDTIIKNLNNSFSRNKYYVVRLPENVPDSLNIPGYYPNNLVKKDIENICIYLEDYYQNKEIIIPAEIISNIDSIVDVIPEGKGIQLFIDSIYAMPKKLQIPRVISDSILNSTEKFEQLIRTDSIRKMYIEQKRIIYNDSIISVFIDSITFEIRQQQLEEDFSLRVNNITDSVKINNYLILKNYNDLVVSAVNDSIIVVLGVLLEYADYIDTSHVSIANFEGESKTIQLRKGDERYTRIWLKNEQQDSLSVLVKNTGKRNLQMLIDNGVTFSRFKQRDTRKFDFSSLEKEISDFSKVGKSYKIETPWRIGGDGSLGFTQTYLQNWKKGGQSAISLLMVLKGFANYSRADGKLKWTNSAVIRNGWIKPGGKGNEIQKNDDRFEITSRVGTTAFKKWFYSLEFNFETQFFRGFKYPTEKHPDPISTFLAPAKTYLKLGLDYNPNKKFSLMISPLSFKGIYVRDTILINKTRFGIEKNRKSFWVPGLNADLKFKKNITDYISFQTKYKMFINFKEPLKKFDINWESLILMKLNDYFNIRLMVHLRYDDDVLFPIYNDNDEKIGEKPRLQVKELMTVGFVYKINRKVLRSKRIR